jgi:ketosteroid isomerase-like protein
MAGPREVATSYWQAEMSRDLPSILRHYAEDAELVVPELGLLVGHEAIAKFYGPSLERFPQLTVEIVRAVEDGATGAIEWSSVHTDRAGKTYPCTGVNFVDVHDDKLQKVHVYYDPTIFASGH